MKKVSSLLVFLLLFYSNNLMPQSARIKEYYDYLYPTQSANVYVYPCNYFGNRLSWILMTLLRMYEATKDKAYLVKFVNTCIYLQQNRYDEIDPSKPPAWVATFDDVCDGNEPDDKEPNMFNSLIIYPMAEFVYIVINEPNHNLYNTPLPIKPYTSEDVVNMTDLNSIKPATYFHDVISYGDFAMWLGKRIEETIFWDIANYWSDGWGISGCHAEFVSQACNYKADGNVMNAQAPFGCALLYMGLAGQGIGNLDPPNIGNFGYGNQNANFLSKARIIASLINGANKHKHYERNCWPAGTYVYDGDVLRPDNNNNNAYYWYYKSLYMKYDPCLAGCQPDIAYYIEHYEDVAHGSIDLWFFKACYDAHFTPENSNDPYFSSTDMWKFRNTFTKKIYYETNGVAHFHNNVVGTENVVDDKGIIVLDKFRDVVLAWMPLYEFDDNTMPNLYDILLQQASVIISTTLPTDICNNSYLGFSEVVKAQWDKDCDNIDLTLFNRDVVYDQEFKAGNILTIAPQEDFTLPQSQEIIYHHGNDGPFADPPFNDGGPKDRFVVESGTNVNFIAGDKIVFKPGTHLKAGCNAHAYIDPDICSHPKQMIPTKHVNEETSYNNSTTKENKNRETETAINLYGTMQNKDLGGGNSNPTDLVSMFAIYPNPTNQIVNIAFTISSEALVSIKITDIIGKEVFSEIHEKKVPAGNYIIPYDFASLSKGIFMCSFEVNGQVVRREKIVVTD